MCRDSSAESSCRAGIYSSVNCPGVYPNPGCSSVSTAGSRQLHSPHHHFGSHSRGTFLLSSKTTMRTKENNFFDNHCWVLELLNTLCCYCCCCRRLKSSSWRGSSSLYDRSRRSTFFFKNPLTQRQLRQYLYGPDRQKEEK